MTDKTSKWETCQTTAPAVIFIYTHVPEGHNPNGIPGFGIRDEPFIRPPDHRHRVWVAEDEIEDTRRVVKIEDDPDVSYTRTDLFEQVVAERDALRHLCGAVYQAAGAYDMPTRFLDALSDAASGEVGKRQKTESLLPCDCP